MTPIPKHHIDAAERFLRMFSVVPLNDCERREAVEFFDELEAAQHDLPAVAAAVIRDNLWNLYD